MTWFPNITKIIYMENILLGCIFDIQGIMAAWFWGQDSSLPESKQESSVASLVR